MFFVEIDGYIIRRVENPPAALIQYQMIFCIEFENEEIAYFWKYPHAYETLRIKGYTKYTMYCTDKNRNYYKNNGLMNGFSSFPEKIRNAAEQMLIDELDIINGKQKAEIED